MHPADRADAPKNFVVLRTRKATESKLELFGLYANCEWVISYINKRSYLTEDGAFC